MVPAPKKIAQITRVGENFSSVKSVSNTYQWSFNTTQLPAIEGNANLRGVLFELVEGTSSERVGTRQTCLPALLLVVVGQLHTHHNMEICINLNKVVNDFAFFVDTRVEIRKNQLPLTH